MRLLWMSLVGSLTTAIMLVSSATYAKERIVIADLNWTGAQAIQYVLKEVLENYLDAEVEFILADDVALMAALAKGDGTVDVYSDYWATQRPAHWEKYVKPGSEESVRVNKRKYVGTESLFIPGFIQDEYGVKSVQDLVDPEIAKLFDSDGDGKGEWWPGVDGWPITYYHLVRAKSYGFADFFEPYFVEQWVLEAQVDAAFKKKQGLLFAFWTPEWLHSAYDLRALEEPKFDGFATDDRKDDPFYNPDGCFEYYPSTEYQDWLERSSITCGQFDTDVYVAYSATLETRIPKIAQFLSQVWFDPDGLNEWILEISREERDPSEVAAEWVEQNKSIVENDWLAGISY